MGYLPARMAYADLRRHPSLFELPVQKAHAQKPADDGAGHRGEDHHGEHPIGGGGHHRVHVRLLRTLTHEIRRIAIRVDPEHEIGSHGREGVYDECDEVRGLAPEGTRTRDEVGYDAQDDAGERPTPVHTGREQDEPFDDTEDDKRPVFGHLGDEKQVDRPGEQRRRSRHPEREHRVGSEEYASHHHEHEIERREDAGCHEVAGSEPFLFLLFHIRPFKLS